MRFLALFFVLFSVCFADLTDPSVLAATDGDPQATISQHVNALTGDFIVFQDDYVVPGVESIPLRRIYVSGDGLGRDSSWEFFPQTKLLLFLASTKHKWASIGQPSGAFLRYKLERNPNASFETYLPDLKEHGKGVTNTAHGVISARTNLKNSRLVKLEKGVYQFIAADGTERIYKRKKKNNTYEECLLHSERLPNKNQILYTYDWYNRLTEIKTTNPSNTKTYAWARFHYFDEWKPSADYNIETSDGKLLEYRYAQEGDEDSGLRFRLTSIKTPQRPEEKIEYGQDWQSLNHLLKKRVFPEGREIFAEYYKSGKNEIAGQRVKIKNTDDPRYDRVKTLYEQVGPNGELVPTHHFFYQVAREKQDHRYVYKEQGITEVVDAFGCKTVFRYTPSFFPTDIESYDEHNRHHYTTKMEWNERGELQRKSFLDANKKEVWAREFSYDEKGNVVEEKFVGDLSGHGKKEVYSTKTKYTQDHLPLRIEKDNGAVTLYSYLPGTPLLLSQFQCDKEKIVKREFYEYDQDNLLIRTVKDDGSCPEMASLESVTYRKITLVQRRQEAPALGFPEVIEERYLDISSSKERVLSKTAFTYQADGKLSRRDQYDAEGRFCYSLHSKYDAMGRPCEETDPFGRVQKTQYDLFGNPVRQESFSGTLVTNMVYDKADRLTGTREVGEIGPDKVVHTHHFSYDTRGRKTAVVDEFGHTTSFAHSPLGNEREIRLPDAFPWQPKIHLTFDESGREVRKVDERGDVTQTAYNAYGMPTQTLYADGSIERCFYNLDGTLAEKIDVHGAVTTFSYDVFGREIHKRIYDQNRTFLMSEQSEYKGDLLVSHTDPVGHATRFFYDGAGRKIADEDEFQRIHYEYDALGRLQCKASSDGKNVLRLITEYDFLDRPIEERSEDESSNLLTKVTYGYDSAGNKALVTRFMQGQMSHERFFYDAFDRLTCHIDALGHQTVTHYDETFKNEQNQRVLGKISKDPLGIHTIEVLDALGRTSSVERKNSVGKLISSEKLHYDGGGKLCRQDSELISEHRCLSKTTTLWENGVMGRLLRLTKAAGTFEQRVTHYTYDASGLLAEIIKPDGLILSHKYDALGRKSRLSSSDGSIDYGYEYDALGRMTCLKNLTTNGATLRTYDKRGSLITERLETGLESTYACDAMGRRIALGLVDGSSVAYAYDALFLREVARLDSNAKSRYTHHYVQYDEMGNLLEEQLPYDLGEQRRAFDRLGRPISLVSPYTQFSITGFDAAGNILQTQTREEERSFAYDDLSQLTCERDHTYVYDSHHNRRKQDGDKHTLNALNELVETKEALLSYDLNGNPLHLETNKGVYRYSYDALDRLIEVMRPRHSRFVFAYDGLHRRLSKTSYRWESGEWRETERLHFLYDDQNEIGAVNASGEICQLRILGRTTRAEMGAAIALELNGQCFIPQHDLFGNVISLVSPVTQTVVESYDYTAFGEEISPESLPDSTYHNPWRYQSKRLDAETQLVLFGRRYYMPSLGRWLTTDPKGYTALSSLYAFCSNNPLTRFDLYGLEDLLDTEQKNESGEGRSLFSSACSSIASFTRDVYSRVTSYFTESSDNYKVGAQEGNNCGCGFINGIRVPYAVGMEQVSLLRRYADGAAFDFTHSASHSLLVDLPKCGWGLIGGKTPAVDLLHQNWANYFQQAPSDALFFQICTSGGCIELYNALSRAPPEMRDRIICVAIAPGAIIPKEMCYQSYNYMSRRDFVSRLDIVGNAKYGDQLIVLEPHPDAEKFDHSITSPTFRPFIEKHARQYLIDNRGKK